MTSILGVKDGAPYHPQISEMYQDVRQQGGKYYGTTSDFSRDFHDYIDHELVITDEQFGKKVGKHAVDYGLNPGDKAAREKFRALVNDIVKNADERVYGEWEGQKNPVLFHIKGDDVVLESRDGGFISIFRGGARNAWIMHIREGAI